MGYYFYKNTNLKEKGVNSRYGFMSPEIGKLKKNITSPSSECPLMAECPLIGVSPDGRVSPHRSVP